MFQVSTEKRRDDFQVLDVAGLGPQCAKYLEEIEGKGGNRAEVVFQWIQQSIVAAVDKGIVVVAPPIVSRVFQELSNGIVGLHKALAIKEVPFPFPYAQMIVILLLVHWMLTPIVVCKWTV